MTHTTIRVAMIVLAALTVTVPCQAQRSAQHIAPAAADARPVAADRRPTGFMLGVRSVASSGVSMPMEGADSNYELKFGAGMGAIVGYGINETFSVFTSLDLAKQKTGANEAVQGDWGFVDMELGARANLPLGGARTIPYVNASVGRRAFAAKATDEDGATADATISGKAIGIGAGVEHAFSRSMSLDAGVDVGFGKFDHLKEDTDQWTQNVGGTRSMRMRLGVTWRPGARGTR